MSATRKAFCNNIWCDDAADLPAAGQWVGQIAFIMDSPVVIKRWDGANWVDVTPDFPSTGGGGIAPIDPVTLNPYFYLTADAGVYNDAGVTLCTNGQSVEQWNDQSGNNRHFGQTTAAKKPTFVTNVINGLPCVSFDGGDCMTRASVGLSSFTIMLGFLNVGAAALLYEHGPDVNTNDGCALFSTTGNSINVKKGGVLSAANTDTGWGQTGNWIAATQMYPAEGTHARHQLLINDWYGAPAPVSSNNPGIATVTDTFNLGGRNNAAGANNMIGSILFCVCFTPAITFNEWRGVMLYLQGKWDI